MPDPSWCPQCRKTVPDDAPFGLCAHCSLSSGNVDDTKQSDPNAAAGPTVVSASDGERTANRETGTWDSTSQDRGTRKTPPWPDLPDYEIVREIARGAMGIVYEARQRSLGRIVALKVVQKGLLASEDEIRRFAIEAEAAGRLDHPGIVPVYEFGQRDGQPYYSMAYVRGKSLNRLVEHGPLPPARAVAVIVKVAEAVQFAHSQGVIHRDIKPSNILIDDAGQARVTDFGLAKRIDAEETFTHSGAIMGSPSYMPPEQARGENDHVDCRADVYSLGATLYAVTTGKPPFRSSSVFDTLRQVLECDPAPPRRLNAEIDRDVETICLKCLEKDPARRYESAQAFADDLCRWLRREPIRARPADALELATKWARRQPAHAALAAVIALALICVAALGARDVARSRQTIDEITKEHEKTKRSELSEIAARKDAQREAAQNLRRLVKSAVGNGNRFVEDGNPLLALPWFIHALKNDPDGPTAELKHRVRLDELTVFDLRNGNPEATTFRIPMGQDRDANPVDGLLFSPDGRWLLARPSRLMYFRTGTYQLLSAFLLHSATLKPVVAPLAIPRDGSRSNAEITPVFFPSSRADEQLAAFSSDGKLVAYADRGNNVGVFNTATGKALNPAPHHSGRIVWLAFHPDGTRLLTTGSDGYSRLWDTATGAPVGPPMLQAGIEQTLFSRDGLFIVSAGSSGKLRVWDADSAELLINGFELRRRINALAAGPKQRCVVFAFESLALPHIWEIPVDERPTTVLEALSIVLSGHEIDVGEGLSPVSFQRLEAARETIRRLEPNYFTGADNAAQTDVPAQRLREKASSPTQ
jgi:hypothetical protein